MKHTNDSFQLKRTVAAVLATSAIALSLAACGQNDDDRTVGQQVDSAIASTQTAAAEAKQDMSATVDKVEAKTESATADVKASAADLEITAKINAALAADDQLSALKIDVDTEAGHVTMTGPAPDAASRDRATTLAKAVDGVMSVDNKLVVSSNG